MCFSGATGHQGIQELPEPHENQQEVEELQDIAEGAEGIEGSQRNTAETESVQLEAARALEDAQSREVQRESVEMRENQEGIRGIQEHQEAGIGLENRARGSRIAVMVNTGWDTPQIRDLRRNDECKDGTPTDSQGGNLGPHHGKSLGCHKRNKAENCWDNILMKPHSTKYLEPERTTQREQSGSQGAGGVT